MRATIALAVFLCGTIASGAGFAARPADAPMREPSYLILAAADGRVLDARWADRDRPLPMGSLIKPFTALAYAEAHRLTYPTTVCRGRSDGCWLPDGHGEVDIVRAIAGSCNAYFHHLSERTTADMLVSTLGRFGVPASAAAITPASMVGLGDGLMLAPSALAHGYLELAARATQPGVAEVAAGLMLSARRGTGRAVGEAMGPVDAFAKTGTAPCVHAPRTSGDGYAVIVYPADRPRLVLLVQAHGRTGAETAALAGPLLRHAVEVR